jgi:hypothetical protein
LAVFVFGTAQRMIEAAISTEVERDQVASALATFVPFYNLGVQYQEDELVHNNYANVVP